MQRILFNFFLAVEGILANKVRALLTGLGIVFGVAAVIAMLAIGSGAKQSILDQMKLIGTNNIIVEAQVPDLEEIQASGNNGAQKDLRPWSPGLNLGDVEAIQAVLPSLEVLSPEIILQVSVVRSGKLESGKVVGVENTFFELNKLRIGRGSNFQPDQSLAGKPVCIIGKQIQTRFFGQDDPLGQQIKCGNTWLTVIGILEDRVAKKDNLERLGIRDFNADIYVPVQTALLHFKNRARLSSASFERRGNSEGAATDNYHQLDRLVIRVQDASLLQASSDVVARLLKRRHQGQLDFEVQIPELLLENQQRTQETFNLVLAVIAGISLLVGGIGIMNIMLASVLERIKEIGVRRSLGATRQDIVWQFLFEAIFISLLGGVLGVIVGVAAASLIANSADIPTIVSTWSIVLSFGVAATVGLVFGLVPAQRAAQQDPIKALRTD